MLKYILDRTANFIFNFFPLLFQVDIYEDLFPV